MAYTAAQIAEQLRGTVLGDASIQLSGFASADSAAAGDLTFAENEAFLAAAERSQASAILVPDGFTASSKVLIRVPNARVAVARVWTIFSSLETIPAGIHPSAVIDPTAQIDPTASVGPQCTVSAGARLGARSVLMAGNFLGRDAQVGADVRLHPNVVVYAKCQLGDRVIIHAGTVIGSDGFGYVIDEGRHRKMPQLGNVIIHSDVEIGANTAIDRGALGSTVIGQGTKIDNLVHIAHNVVMGKHCLIMGQAGFAGSTRLGDYCVVASQSGIAGHLRLGNQATVGAKSGVMRDIPDKGTVLGIPAMPHQQAKRQWIGVQQLPDVIHRLREMEKQIAALNAKVNP